MVLRVGHRARTRHVSPQMSGLPIARSVSVFVFVFPVPKLLVSLLREARGYDPWSLTHSALLHWTVVGEHGGEAGLVAGVEGSCVPQYQYLSLGGHIFL